MSPKNLQEIKKEMKRFKIFLNLAIERLKSENIDYDQEYISGYKETGAVRRAALDLKRCLTKNL